MSTFSVVSTIIMLAILAVFLYLDKNPASFQGFLGEWRARKELAKLPQGYQVLHDLMIEVNDKMTQIDHVVIAKTGIFIIETKCFTGTIYGKARQKKWTQYYSRNRKYQFQNPLHQNYGHLKQLSDLLEQAETDFIPLVVFNNSIKLKVDDESQVFRREEMNEAIQSYTAEKFTNDECQTIITKLKAANIQSLSNKRKHKAKIQQNLKRAETLVTQNICPKCESELVVRQGQHGEFLGCSTFPKCRYTAKVATPAV
ncbi:MAG: NERD domain-containing protein [Culicoidibacterales bacterium]